jgi:predicted phosphoribosyltransferase
VSKERGVIDLFKDRENAGKRLARKLEKYKDKGVLILAIPRGGVEVGYEVAKHLDADLSLVITRKLPQPGNPEAGFGAMAEDGSKFIYKNATIWLDEDTIDRIMEEQKEEIERRIEVLRDGRPLPDIEGRMVILVDDGIAMGSTMRASIELCKNKGADKIVVGSPVSSREVAKEIEGLVDEVIIMEMPAFYRAVAQVYENWYDVPDSEVVEIMNRWEESGDK